MLQRPALSALLAGLLVAALALPALAAGETCSFQAYANDPDPAGTNVRSGPGTSFPVIGVLKPDADSDDGFTPEFEISGFDSGWFRIGDAVIGQYGDGPEQTVFSGQGWISAKLTGFDIEDIYLRDGPGPAAATTLEFDGDWGLDQVSIKTVNACEGRSLNVTLTNTTGASATGWISDLCGSQVTTCP